MKLHSLFSDHMVLQRGVPVPVRGEATPGSQVQIKLAGRSASATADATGQWCATLDPLDAGGPHELRVTAGDESIVVRDVMVGEVWLCSGQSNMQMVVSAAADAKREIAAADFPGLRMFSVPVEIALEPRQGVGGQWRVCSPQTVASFSATAYYFGRELHRELGVPIGL